MGKYDGFLLITDFDGTIAINGNVSEENCAAIRKFQAEGGIYTVASGRQPEWLAKFEKFFKCNTYAVLMNGTVIYDTENKRDIKLSPLDENIYGFAHKIFDACPNIPYFRVHTYESYYDVKPGEDFPTETREQPIYKIIFRAPTENSDEYLAKITKLAEGKYYISRSWVNGIELQALGTSKGDAVRFFKKLYGEKIHTVIAAGDYENDVEMLKAADIGYAVGNAQPRVKAAADRITVPCSEHAIVKIIKEICK